MDVNKIWNSLEKFDPGVILARDTAANTVLIKKLFNGQWLNEYVRLYVWESARIAGLDNETIMRVVSAYDSYGCQCAVDDSQERYDSWLEEYREAYENE